MGRFVVRVTGTNFRDSDEYNVPEGSGGLVEESWPETVKVEVGGVAATSVEVLSPTMIQFQVPMFGGDPKDLPAQVDVRVTNLDDNGEEVPGESVTVEDGFTFFQKDLTKPCHLVGLIGKFILLVRRAVLPNTSIATDIDWNDVDEDPRKVHEAGLPALYVRGPNIADPADDQTIRDEETEQTSDDALEYKIDQEPMTATVRFQILGVSDNVNECLNLGQAFLEWVKNQSKIEVLRDPIDETKGSREYEFGFILNGQPTYKRVGTLFQFMSTVEVERVLLTPEDFHVVERGATVFNGTDIDWDTGIPVSWIEFERKRN